VSTEAAVPRLFEFEAFGTSVGLAMICGGLSLPFPILISPTAALAALALAGWLSLTRRHGSGTGARAERRTMAALVVLGVAGAGFLASPPLLAPFRGLVLSCGLLPLLWVSRVRPFPQFPMFPE
jgi:hypothetical protein